MPHPAPSDDGATNPLLRRLLPLYFRLARGVTLGVRAAVLDDRDRVFLLRHTYVRGWHMPGGGVEVGESAPDALARELEEEARIRLTGAPALVGAYFNAGLGNRDHVLVYAVRAFEVTEDKRPDREIAEAGFFPLDALPEETTGATRRRLDEIAGRRMPDGVW